MTDVVYLEHGNDDNHTDGQLDMDLVRQMKELKEQLHEREDQLVKDIAECKQKLAQLQQELTETKKALGRSAHSPPYTSVNSKGLTNWIKNRLEKDPATSCQMRDEFFGNRIKTKAERRTALSCVNTRLSVLTKDGIVFTDRKADFSHGRVFRMNGVKA